MKKSMLKQSSMNTTTSCFSGYQAIWGCTGQSLALFRICLGVLLTVELVLRFRFLHAFYSDEGTLPLALLHDRVDTLYKAVCLHCQFGAVCMQQLLLSVQVVLGVCFTLGIRTKWAAVLSWYLYFSLTLRNTWLNYILDRYFHYLLFLSMFLPLDLCWTFAKKSSVAPNDIITPATIAAKLLVLWIYLDAGGGKYLDPLKGWSFYADPLPALDTYVRHTLVAQYLYALLQPQGLRVLTPIVVYVELLAAPVALLAAYMGQTALVWTAVALICSLHIGIALTIRNAALLSLVACTAWAFFLPLGCRNTFAISKTQKRTPFRWTLQNVLATTCILAMVAGSFWLETFSRACDQSVKHIWSTLLHNRWNVFVGAEEYVTWEIAPGLLADGSIVDIWGRQQEVSWSLPGAGAPCTATARPGRWRSFPYLAELHGDEADALWSYLCKEWDRENYAVKFPGRKLIRYNFFMLQADVLPNMTFSPTRKRLIITYNCSDTDGTEGARDEQERVEKVKSEQRSVSGVEL